MKFRWALIVGLFALILHLPYLRPGGPWARVPTPLRLGQDEATVLYDAVRISHGEVMYRDFFEFQGPVFYYAYAGLFTVVGPSYPAARLLQLITASVSAMLLALLVARFAGCGAGVGAALIHAAVLVSMWPFAYPHWLAEALALGGMLLLCRDSKWADLVAGIGLALSLMTIQSVGLPVLVAATIMSAAPSIARRELNLSKPFCLLLGAGVTLALIAGYFAAQGALGALYDAMFRWTQNHYHAGQKPEETVYAWWVEEAIAEHRNLAAPWRLLAAFGLRLAQSLPLLGIAGAAVVALVSLRRLWRRDDRLDVTFVAGTALAALSPLFLAPIRPDITHVAQLGSFGICAFVAGAGALEHRFAKRTVVALLCSAGLLCLVTYGHKIVHTWKPSQGMSDWRGEVLKLPEARRMDLVLPKDARIVVGAMGGFYYFFIRPAAAAFTYIPAERVTYFSEAQWRRLADEIATRRPAALRFVGKQWAQILQRKPELAAMYKAQGGMLVPKP